MGSHQQLLLVTAISTVDFDTKTEFLQRHRSLRRFLRFWFQASVQDQGFRRHHSRPRWHHGPLRLPIPHGHFCQRLHVELHQVSFATGIITPGKPYLIKWISLCQYQDLINFGHEWLQLIQEPMGIGYPVYLLSSFLKIGGTRGAQKFYSS